MKMDAPLLLCTCRFYQKGYPTNESGKNEIFLPAFDQQIELELGTTTISFMPEEPGVYPYTCWMGMQNTITVIEE